MGNRSADVTLTIRAKNEADRAINAVSGALKTLLSGQEAVAGSGVDLAAMLIKVDKAYATIAGSAKDAGAAFDRQNASLVENELRLSALRQQAEAAGKALGNLNGQGGKSFVGPVKPETLTRYQAMTAEVANLGSQISKLTREIELQEAGITASQSSLIRLAAAESAAGAASEEARRRIEAETKALRDKADAARVSETINRTTGVTRSDADGGYAALTAGLRQQETDAARVTAEYEAQGRAAAKVVAAQTEINALVDHTSGKSARSSASVFEDAGPTSAEQSIAAATEASAARQQAALRDAAIAHQQFEARVKAGAVAMREEEGAAEQDAAAFARLRDELNPLTVIQSKLAAETAKVTQWQREGKLTAEESAAALLLLKDNADKAAKAIGQTSVEGGKKSPFGLKSYELTNLGYQVNDVVTQLASGTSLTRTLGQQGGQIAQIFPKVSASIVSAFTNPAFLGAAAVIGGITLALKHAADEAERVRQFNAVLAASADGAHVQAAALAQADKALDAYGLSADQAAKVVKKLFADGVDASQILAFGRAAKNLADVLGIDVVEAAGKVSSGFTGNISSIEKLDQSLNFLTASERDRIRALSDAGEIDKARALAFDIFSRKQEDAAQKQRGPWSDAARSLGAAYHDFLDALSNTTAVQETLGFLESAAHFSERIAKALKEASATNVAQAINGTADQNGGIKAFPLAGDAPSGSRSAPVVPKPAAPTPESERTKKANQNLDEETDKLREQNRVLSDQQRITAAIAEARRTAEDHIAATDTLKFADEAHQRLYIEQQIGVARQAIEKKIADERKAALADEEKAIKGFSTKVIGPESGGRADAKNAGSSALGVGQFLKGTFVSLFKETYPEAAKGLSDDAIAALRVNVDVSKNLIEVYARKNADILKAAGVQITEANLYAAHFLGAAGAVKLSKASPDTRTDSLFSKSVVAKNKGYFTNPDGSNRTAGQLQSFLATKISDSSAAQTAGAVAVDKVLSEREDTQKKINAGIDEENEKRALTTKELAAQDGLFGTALIAQQRQKAIADAILAKQQEIDKSNLELAKKGLQPLQFTDQQKSSIAVSVGEQFDAQHTQQTAQARLGDAERPVSDLKEQIGLLKTQADILRSIGSFSQADDIDKQIDGLNDKLKAAYDQLIAFYQALSPDQRVQLGILDQSQLDSVIEKLGQAKDGVTDLSQIMIGGVISAKDFFDAFASSATGAFDGFLKNVAAGQNIFKAFGTAVLQFAASFAKALAEAIVKALVFAAALKAVSAITGIPVIVLAGGAIATAGVHHDGSIVGSPTRSRGVSPSWFTNAQRYHTGGIAGFAPDEVPAILQRGEEVLPADDPRHRANGGLGGGGATNLKVVNAFDPATVLEQALATRSGEKVMMNHVRANQRAYQALIS